MTRRHGISTLAAILALACTTVFAQPNTGNKTGQGNQNKKVPNRGGDRDEGTEYGKITTVRSYGAQASDKVGQINLQTMAGKQVSVHLTDRTRYLLAGADMDRAMVNALLVKDVPVTLQWRYSAETGGKVAYSIEIRTVAIQGTIKKANKRQITVAALPIEREEEYEPVAPPIRAGGRKAPEPPRKVEKKAPTPKTITLIVQNSLTRISLNGEKTEAAAIKPKMTFDAIVIDGGPRWLIELNAHTEGARSANTGEKEGETDKPDKENKAKKTGKDKPMDKPKPPQD